MESGLKHPKRKLLRLKDFDYSTEAAYFVTICTRNKEEFFGRVITEKMVLNDPGKMIEEWWKKLEHRYEDVILEKYIVMPNHLHGIIMIIRDDIVWADPCVRPKKNLSLSDIIKWFKIMTTNQYIKNVKERNWRTFDKRLWQRSFYDRIIRDGRELNNIRAYIMNNPIKWKWEKTDPENIGKL
jgi:REP element-mobilizing transposase RayT